MVCADLWRMENKLDEVFNGRSDSSQHYMACMISVVYMRDM